MAATVSVLAAVVLNLAGLTAFGAVVADWRGGRVQTGSSAWITAVYVTPRAPVEAAPEATRTAAVVPEKSAVAVPERKPAALVAAATPAPKHTPLADATNAVRYYRTGEVDRPAQPDSDWNLDTAALDAAGLSAMVFEVFVSGTGEIVECTILEPKSLLDGVREGLEARLRQTTVQPAQRAGAAVPSVRRIEISVEPGSQ